MIKNIMVSLIHKWKNKNRCRFTKSSIINAECSFEGANFLDKNCVLLSSDLGYGSYLGNNSKIIKTKVGRYVCIGPNVEIISGQHPTRKFVSIHPIFYSVKKQVGFSFVKKQLFQEEIFLDKENKYHVILENDIWIGNGAKIMEGVRIHNGAIIAAGSVVTRDVEPYSIVGGIPARLIRYRFEQNDINYLQNLEWWNKDKNWLEEHAILFEDINKLKDFINKREGI